MPIGISAKKSLRKSIQLNKVNSLFRKTVKKLVKAFNDKPTEDNWKKLNSILDKAVGKNILHRNKVARLKSRYAKMVKTTVTKKAEPKAKVVKVAKVTKVKKTVKKTAKDKMSK